MSISRSAGRLQPGSRVLLWRLTCACLLYVTSSGWVVVLASGMQPVFSFASNFTDGNQSTIAKKDDVITTNGKLILNNNGNNSNSASAGRAFYINSVQLQDSATKSSFASFSTSASLSVARGRNNSCPLGDGMAFIISGNMYNPGWDSKGYLGILNSTNNNGDPGNHVFAIEIDTYRNAETGFNDSSSCHLAALVNSMEHSSNRTINMCDRKNLVDCATHCNNALHADASNKTITLFVYYNGTSNGLTATLHTGPKSNFTLSFTVNLSQVFSQIDHLYVGFSGSTHDGCAGTHTIHDWQFSTDFTPPPPPSPSPSPAPTPGNSTPSNNSPGLKAQTVAGISLLAIGGFLFALFILLVYLRSKCLRSKNT